MTRKSTDDSSTSPKRHRLAVLMFLLGACGLAYEYTISKIAADLLGNSVQQWATIIATMLFAMGLGAEWQRKIATRDISDRLISSQVALALVGGFGPILLVYSFSLLADYYILVQYGLALVVGTLIGFEIPLIMRVNEDRDPEMKTNLAKVLKMDYVGALVGALVWTFIFVRYLSVSRISFILGLISIASAWLIFKLYRDKVRKPRRRLLEMGGAVILLLVGLAYSKPLMLHAEQFLYRDRIVFTATTPYQHIVLTESGSETISCYINGHLQFKEEDEYIYHENLVHPVMLLAGSPNRVLILGGGDGLAVREVLKYDCVEEIVLVDIDPQMTDLAKTQPHLVRLNQGAFNDRRVLRKAADGVHPSESYTLKTQNKRSRVFSEELHEVAQLKVVNLDASVFLQQTEGTFDVVILDFPDPSSPDLAKLYSRPFYESLKASLHPTSLVVQQSGSPFHAKEAFLCIGRTMKASGFSVLPYHDNVPSFGEWGWWLAKLEETGSGDLLADRLMKLQLESLEVDTAYLTIPLIKSSLHFGRFQLDTENSDYTSLTENRVYHYYLQAWK